MTLRIKPIVVVLFLSMFAAGCASDARSTIGPELRMTPDAVAVIDGLMQSEAVLMTVHPSCREIGSTVGAETIGGYLSILLARQSEGDHNWSEVTVQSEQAETGQTWRSRVLFHHNKTVGGVEFLVTPRSGRIIPTSFRCIGG